MKKNIHAQAMGKLSAKARKTIHTSEYYSKLGKKSAKVRKKKQELIKSNFTGSL